MMSVSWRSKSSAWLAALLVWLMTALVPAWGQAPVPPLTARVVDTTGSLPAEAVSRLERQLAELEKATGAQVAVLMVGTTDGEPIEGYAVRVFENWKLGRQGVDDGVLLVVARDDRAMRIEVGYGLEGAVTDAQSSRLIREHITPHFAQGDFAGGIQAGVDGLAALIRQEPLPPPTAGQQGEDEDMWYGLFVLALIALFANPVVLTVVGAVMGWILLPGWGAWLGALVGGGLGALVGVVLSVTGVRQAIRKAARKGGGPGGPGGWGGGGRGGGGWGGGGGFGGGGGRSGGGGASGRW